jgi:hypothetical protein
MVRRDNENAENHEMPYTELNLDPLENLVKTIARLGTIAVTILSLAAAIAGCSSGSSNSSDAASAASVTSSASSAPSAEAGTQALPEPAAAARPLSDFAEDQFYSFALPGGQIQCRVVDGNLNCQTEEPIYSVSDSALCGFYPGIEQGGTSRFGYLADGPRPPCATIIQGEGYQSPHTLAHGQRVTAELSSGRTVTCTSAVDGLTCTQAAGSGPGGFFLSVDSFTVL